MVMEITKRVFTATLLTLLCSCMAKADSLGMTIKVLDNTCAVDTELAHVDLGTIAIREIRHNGGYSRPVPFSIKLKNCGLFASKVKIYATGITVPGDPDTLQLQNYGATGTASGIGVVVRNEQSSIVSINTNDNPGIYLLNAGADTNINFIAQYKRLGNDSSAGVADAMVNFSFEYL